MSDPPPKPTINAALLLALVGLIWRPSGTLSPLGTPLGHAAAGDGFRYLYVVSGGIDGTWKLGNALPAGLPDALISVGTFEIISQATLNADGSISHGGSNYRLQSWWNGAQFTAVAISV